MWEGFREALAKQEVRTGVFAVDRTPMLWFHSGLDPYVMGWPFLSCDFCHTATELSEGAAGKTKAESKQTHSYC